MPPESQNTQLVEAIFTVSRFMRERMCFDTELAKLSMLQLQVLIFLKKSPQAQMKEIATHFKIELPSATSLINTLCKLLLTERKADTNDRRLVRIALTKQGEVLLEKAMKERSKKITETLSYLSTSDQKDLLRIIKKLVTSMEKNYEK